MKIALFIILTLVPAFPASAAFVPERIVIARESDFAEVQALLDQGWSEALAEMQARAEAAKQAREAAFEKRRAEYLAKKAATTVEAR